MPGLNLGPLVAQARTLAAQYRFDAYEVVRQTGAADSAGGATVAETVVESGACILTPGIIRPDERVIAGEAGSTNPYVLRNLPWNTTLKPSDVVTVGGRRFEIVGVLRAGATNVAARAIAEERL